MKTGMCVSISLVALAIGVAVGFTLANGDSPAGASEPSTTQAENRELEREIERLRASLADARADAETGKGEPAVADEPIEPALPSPDAAAGAADAGASPSERAAHFGEAYGSLERVDWESVGSSLSEMNRLIDQVARGLAEGKSPEAEAVGRISQLNGKLITAALTIREEIPGHQPNGSFTHPAFMVNAMVATLEAAGKPLLSAQNDALVRTAEGYLDRDRRRLAAYDDGTWEIRKIYEEAELKDRFFADAFALMSPEQVAVLDPAETHNRLRLSLFSSGTMLVVWARPFSFADRGEIVDELLRGTADVFGLSEDERARTREFIEGWARGLPAELLDEPGNRLDLEGMVETDRVIAWAKLVHAMRRDLSAELGSDPERLAKVIRGTQIPVGFLRPVDGN